MQPRSIGIVTGLLREIQAFVLSDQADRRHVKVGPLQLWKEKRAFQIRFLREIGLRPEHHFLDLGCGTLRGGLPIIDYLETGHYCGIDSRHSVLRDARKELRDAGLEHKSPALVPSDRLCALNLAARFDVIWAFSVLLHMSDDIANECFAFVRRHLEPGGVFYANVQVGPRKDAWWRWYGFPVVWRSVDFYREVAARHGFTLRDLGTLDSLGSVSRVRSIDAQRMFECRRTSTVPSGSIRTRAGVGP